jgi:signal transduction histidine kinase/DNA-binding response OmpR family regulator
MVEAKNGDIWIATSSGLDVFENKTGDFTRHYFHDNAKPLTSLSNDNTVSILQDGRGLFWVATREGLNYYDSENDAFTTLRKQDGLADNIITSVVEDKEHNIWAGTPSGLCHIIVSRDAKNHKLNLKFRNYYEADGLQGREFNEYAAYVTHEGEVIFGGANGFNMFLPQEISTADYDPQLVLTDLLMFNKSVNTGEKLNGHIILPQSISETKSIALKYNENVFSIEFAALNFYNTGKLRYAYMLEGFNNEWFIADDKTRRATYTNLDPGTYTFRVRTINENGTWSNEAAMLTIQILPPFWKEPLAYVIYAVLLGAGLYAGRMRVLKRARLRFAIEQERMEAQRLHDLDMMKIRFFTNVSHDFRTPLSLIIAPIDKIIRNTAEPGQKGQLQMIQRNARRLLNLVNQLLDFRKMEMQELKLNPSKGDIVEFARNISNSFTDLAEKKSIDFSFSSSISQYYTFFDHDKIERILFNLLSNAFKFTPGSGAVSVEISAADRGDGKLMAIKVCDTGIGIPPEKQEKIFERFFQDDVPGNMVSQGSGIGLAITKEFTKLHNGSISVESSVNQGSCFTVQLPLKQAPGAALANMHPAGETGNGAEQQEDAATDEYPVTPESPSGPAKEEKLLKKPCILIIEDNDDLRFYLKDNLRQYFTITEAVNGKAGWQKALSAHPDIIVSDINMPEMNGIELCRKIKGDKRTQHVPVILLTALSAEEHQLKGLETGASDYISKPFNFEILLSKIRNIIAQQETSKRTYQKHVNTAPSAVKVESVDEKFIQQALEVVEKNIANPNFSVEELSRELCMSRVALYKKLLGLTFKTPVEFIRSIRLKRAAQLLEKSRLTIAEIAYEVGFNDPKYFSRFFKAEFNMLPSAYQAEKRKETAANSAAAPAPEESALH